MQLVHNLSLNLLMDRVKNSDQSAYKLLYDKLWERLYIRAFTIIRRKQTAEDIVQEVFIDLWQRRKSIKNDNIEAYLYRAVQLKAFNHYRNAKNRENILKGLLYNQSFESNATEETINFNETRKTVLQSIQNLSPKCKMVFELSRIEGLKNKEISEQLQISTSTVENHITNAIKSIKSNVGTLLVTFLLFLN